MIWKDRRDDKERRRKREYRLCGKQNGSVTVEAAVLFPVLFTITFLLVQNTLLRYEEVQQQAGILYDAVVREEKIAITDRIRIADTAFEFFGK